MEKPTHKMEMEEPRVENTDTIIEVEAPVINPVTVIDVDMDVDVGKESKKPALLSVFRLEKRLLTGTFLLIFLIFPTLGAGYIKYRLRNEVYKPVLFDDKFPLVDYESAVPIEVDVATIENVNSDDEDGDDNPIENHDNDNNDEDCDFEGVNDF